MGRLRVTEKEGEINNGRREGERRKQRTRRGGERGRRGKLEDCVPLARCSARGGLLPLEPARRRRKERWRKEEGKRVKGGADITSSIMVQLLLCTTYPRREEDGEEGGHVHATALWRTMFNHLSVDSFGFN